MPWVAPAMIMGAATLGSAVIGNNGRVKSSPTLSPEQQQLLKSTTGYLGSLLGQAQALNGGQFFQDMPAELSGVYDTAMKNLSKNFGITNQAFLEAAQGKPAYAYDPSATKKDWEENYVTPVMASWRENILPVLKEQFNTPGTFYSTARGRGIENAAGKFYNENVASTLFGALESDKARGFTSGENAAQRQLGAAAGLSTAGFTSAMALPSAKASYTQDQVMKVLQAAMGLSTGSTQDTVGLQGTDPFGNLAKVFGSMYGANQIAGGGSAGNWTGMNSNSTSFMA